jgi:hypothetical protein
MIRRSIRKLSFFNWRLCLQTSGIYRLAAIPGTLSFKRRGEAMPAPPGLAPKSVLRLRPRRALPSAPVSISVEEEIAFAKLVIVADREK